MTTGLKANSDGSAAIQVGGSDVITLTSGGAATFVTSPTTVQAGTAAAPSITFSGDTNTGIYSPGADTVGLTAGGTLVGSVGLGTTLALQGATSQSGTGITFPATQSASSNANTLDDYEEGTWSPMMAAGAGSVSLATGYYVKVGQIVYCTFDSFGVSTSGLSGNVSIQGLPFTGLSSLSQSTFMFPTGVNNTPVLFYVEANTTNVALYKAASATSSVANLTIADFATSTPSMRHSFVYRSNS